MTIMGSYIEQMDVTKEYKTGNSSIPLNVIVSREPLRCKLLSFVKVTAEYALGIHIGFGIGWLIGFFAGTSYVKHNEPVYIKDLSQLLHWRLIPYECARSCAIIGVVIGAIVIAICTLKSEKYHGESMGNQRNSVRNGNI